MDRKTYMPFDGSTIKNINAFSMDFCESSIHIHLTWTDRLNAYNKLEERSRGEKSYFEYRKRNTEVSKRVRMCHYQV